MPGKIVTLGQLTPVRPDGFVMRDANGQGSYHEGLPADVRRWSDTDALRALLLYGGDAVGNVLLAEHLALQTLAAAGVSTTASRVVDAGVQRFLELERFDRAGALGRRALMSLAALNGEFVGNATAPWPVVTAELARQKVITEQARADATLLYAFGTLIGNTDMHAGNLSFVSDQGRPYGLSPAYDMLPMAFSPTAGGVGGAACALGRCLSQDWPTGLSAARAASSICQGADTRRACRRCQEL
jgi:hypothetical protein